MAQAHASVEVDVPISTAYNQWTQFEEFPQFMENVESVTQIDDTHLRWVAEIGGDRREWQAEITRQVPDQLIVWRALDEDGSSGEVRFQPLEGDRTCVDVSIEWQARGLIESIGDKLGSDDRGVKRDLERFKELIESRGQETGAWRGEVAQGERVDSEA